MKRQHMTAVPARALALLLALTLAAGCLLAGCGAEQPTGADAEAARQPFDDFTDELFREEFSGSTVNLHQLVEDPQAYGFDEELEATWGELDFSEEAAAADSGELRENLAQLRGYDYDALTGEQQLTYEILESSLEDALEWQGYTLYDNLLGASDGVQAEIPLSLALYELRCKQDVEDYLALVRQLPDYFDQVLDYAAAQAREGLFMADFAIADTIEQCRAQIANGETYYLTEMFEEKLAQADFLTEAEREAYRAEHLAAMEEAFFPAYQSLIDGLEALKGSGANDGGLANVEHGREYYALLVRDATGSDKTVEEIKAMLKAALRDSMSEMTALAAEDPALWDITAQSDLDWSDPATAESLLDAVEEQLGTAFPTLAGKLQYEIRFMPDAMTENNTAAAFYSYPAIDGAGSNLMYFNLGSVTGAAYDQLYLYHEGLPGHMYQINYFYQTNPSLVRHALSFLGYSEGWAQYAQYYGCVAAGMEETAARMLELDEICSYSLYGLLDIGVNSEGWTREQASSFLAGYGIVDPDTAEELYNLMVEMPAGYLPYAVGWLEILELRASAEETLGSSFDQKAFHAFLLDIGPAPFEIIRERMDAWLAEQRQGAPFDGAARADVSQVAV